MSAIISYKGNTVATVLAGDHVRLACKGNVMGSNIRVECTDDSVENTNGSYDEGYSAGYNAGYNKCTEDMQESIAPEYDGAFIIRNTQTGEIIGGGLEAPTLTLAGETLIITDESGLAEEFEILVDGENNGSVEANN